jgi:hypothetical protein
MRAFRRAPGWGEIVALFNGWPLIQPGKFEDPYNAPSVERDERVRIDQTFAMIA